MHGVNAALAIGAAAVLVLGLVSGYIKNRLWVSEPLIALLLSICVGPVGLDLVDLDLSQEGQNAVLLEAARVTLALSVMGAALRLPYAYEARHWRELAVILGLGMPLMWLASSLVVFAVLGPPVLVALLIGAILTPPTPSSRIRSSPAGSPTRRCRPACRMPSRPRAGPTTGWLFCS